MHYLGLPEVSLITDQKDRQTILFHSVSVGEINAAEWLIRKYISSNYKIVISTTCEDGMQLIQKKYPEAQVVIFPLDFLFSVRNFIKRIAPDLVIICETDFWPTFMYALNKINIPIILLNGRISRKAGIYFRLLPILFNPLFHLFSHIYLQSELDRTRLKKIGIRPEILSVTGNTKLNITYIEKYDVQTDLKIVVAGSTHKYDEEILSGLLPLIDLLIIAPRKISRVKEVSDYFTSLNPDKKPVLYSKQKNVLKSGSKIVIIDTIGDLQSLYKFATLFAYVGGGFEITGLHNILEPLRVMKPVVFGSNILNFKDICIEIINQKIAFSINNTNELLKLANDFIENGRKIDYPSKIKKYLNENSRSGELIFHAISKFFNH